MQAMSESWIQFLQRWVILTLGVVVAAHIVPGIRYDDAVSVVVASLLLGLLNALRPLLAVLSLPILVFSLGMFWFVINALLFWLVGYLVKGFHVDGFGTAFFGGLVVSLVSLILNLFLGKGPRVQVRTGRQGENPRSPRHRIKVDNEPPKGGKGPVIDV
jgi:putative membrane protein